MKLKDICEIVLHDCILPDEELFAQIEIAPPLIWTDLAKIAIRKTPSQWSALDQPKFVLTPRLLCVYVRFDTLLHDALTASVSSIESIQFAQLFDLIRHLSHPVTKQVLLLHAAMNPLLGRRKDQRSVDFETFREAVAMEAKWKDYEPKEASDEIDKKRKDVADDADEVFPKKKTITRGQKISPFPIVVLAKPKLLGKIRFD